MVQAKSNRSPLIHGDNLGIIYPMEQPIPKSHKKMVNRIGKIMNIYEYQRPVGKIDDIPELKNEFRPF
jgi:hypothetical protein